MFVIMLTGSYNFFNFLYIALCFSLADNSWLDPSVKQHRSNVTSWLSFLLNSCVFLGLAVATTAAFNLHIKHDYTVGSSVNFTEEQFNKFVAVAVPAGIYVGG